MEWAPALVVPAIWAICHTVVKLKRLRQVRFFGELAASLEDPAAAKRAQELARDLAGGRPRPPARN